MGFLKSIDVILVMKYPIVIASLLFMFCSAFRYIPLHGKRMIVPSSIARNALIHNTLSAKSQEIPVSDELYQDYKYIMRPKVSFVLGGPGAGKGTQCEKLSAEFGMIHLSAGQLLRDEQKKDTPDGNLIDTYLKEGKIVPVEISLNLLKKAIQSTNCHRYLVDGFPRNFDNLEGWNRIMDDLCNIEMVMFIDCKEEELERRIINRGISSGRTDDNIVTARKRFNTFKIETMPVVKFFENDKKWEYLKLAGDQTIDKVYSDIKDYFIPKIEKEITILTQILENSVKTENWVFYDSLCDLSLVSSKTEKDFIRMSNEVTSTEFPRLFNVKVEVKGNESSISYTLDQQANSKKFIRHWRMIDGNWRQTQVL